MRAANGSGEVTVADGEMFNSTERWGQMAMEKMLAGPSTPTRARRRNGGWPYKMTLCRLAWPPPPKANPTPTSATGTPDSASPARPCPVLEQRLRQVLEQRPLGGSRAASQVLWLGRTSTWADRATRAFRPTRGSHPYRGQKWACR